MTPILLGCVSAFLFGAMTVLVRIALRQGVSPPAGTLFTIFPACVVTAIVALAHGEWNVASAWPFFFAGLLAPGIAQISRRTLLKGSLAAGAGLVIGFRWPLEPAAQGPGSGVFAPNQWLKIDRDGVVTITNSVPEMGQGSLTTMPMIVADELDADWARVKVEQAPANPKLYANPVTGTQSYGGSRGVRDHLQLWRKAGAAGRNR